MELIKPGQKIIITSTMQEGIILNINEDNQTSVILIENFNPFNAQTTKEKKTVKFTEIKIKQ